MPVSHQSRQPAVPADTKAKQFQRWSGQSRRTMEQWRSFGGRFRPYVDNELIFCNVLDKADMVSLDEAAKLLLGDGQNPSYMRNANAAKVRRLYDIANVLSSLNLIEKTHQSESRKPAFRWLGTKGNCEGGVTIAIPPIAPKSGKRMFGTELTNVEIKRAKLLSSIDQKPNKTQVLSHDLKECNKAAQRQLQGSKSFVFGPFNPPKAPKEEVTEQKEETVSDFESFASSLRPSYHSQALHELFSHYMEAYNSWFAEIAGGSNMQQQPLKKSVHIGH